MKLFMVKSIQGYELWIGDGPPFLDENPKSPFYGYFSGPCEGHPICKIEDEIHWEEMTGRKLKQGQCVEIKGTLEIVAPSGLYSDLGAAYGSEE